jgi:hypothetical protein
VVREYAFLALNDVSLALAARMYAREGMPVFPLVPREKRPLTPRGVYSATTDQEMIVAWWKRWPQANIGIPTGTPSGFCVLDIDPRHDGLASFQRLTRHAADWARPGEAPMLTETLRQLTGGGGVHLVYQMPEKAQHLANACHFAGYMGLDLKVTGGYIVVGPSLHPSGGVYRWQHAIPPAPFPQVLLDLSLEHQQRAFSRPASPESGPRRESGQRRSAGEEREADPEYWLHCALNHARPGRRHAYACFLACRLAEYTACSFEEAADWIQEYVWQVPQPPGDPYESSDALGCLKWAWDQYRV